MTHTHFDLPEEFQIQCDDNEFIVESWEEFSQYAFQDSFVNKIHRYRTPYVFRGIPRATYKLKTSLQRIGDHFEHVEHHLLRMFKNYARNDMALTDSLWEWLAIAQHYGLPTRLMDWTYSPYVGLHFALTPLGTGKAIHMKTADDINAWLKNNPDETADSYLRPDFAVIWCVNLPATRIFMPNMLDDIRKKESSWGITLDMLNRLIRGDDETSFREVLDNFSRLGDGKEFAVFFEPPSLDDRISTQYALFSILSTASMDFDDWLIEKRNSDLLKQAREEAPEDSPINNLLYFKILIPPYLKWEFRDKLDAININERVLFPGLDGLSSWIKRHYGNGPN